VTAEMVAQLALLAGLELSRERRHQLAEQLEGLLTDADRVNRFMEQRRQVQPGVRFYEPDVDARPT
jgi:Asp-tRNA(Asn)/Glu-tRNA(Gln) amidotransferase C subunit